MHVSLRLQFRTLVFFLFCSFIMGRSSLSTAFLKRKKNKDNKILKVGDIASITPSTRIKQRVARLHQGQNARYSPVLELDARKENGSRGYQSSAVALTLVDATTATGNRRRARTKGSRQRIAQVAEGELTDTTTTSR